MNGFSTTVGPTTVPGFATCRLLQWLLQCLLQLLGVVECIALGGFGAFFFGDDHALAHHVGDVSGVFLGAERLFLVVVAVVDGEDDEANEDAEHSNGEAEEVKPIDDIEVSVVP